MIIPRASNPTSTLANPCKRSDPPATVQVAVIDTGLDPDSLSPDRLIGFKDFVNGRTEAYDDHGQGTHVAGCILNPPHENFQAHIESAGFQPEPSLSDTLQGIEWAIHNRENLKLDGFSLSVLPATDRAGDDAIEKAVQRAIESGLTVILPDHS